MKRMSPIAYLVILVYLALLIIILWNVLWLRGANGEEAQLNPQIVIVDKLNGRFRPSKKSPALAEYVFLDELEPTGKWSKDHAWIQVTHPEEGVLWVSIDFISERLDVFEVYTLSDTPIKVRSKPETGKVKRYLHKEEHIEITQVVMGYGRCEYGWIDLEYFIEEYPDESYPYSTIISRR